MRRYPRPSHYISTPVEQYRRSIQTASNMQIGFNVSKVELDQAKLLYWTNALQDAVSMFNFWWSKKGKDQVLEYSSTRYREKRSFTMAGVSLENHRKGVLVNFLKRAIANQKLHSLCTLDSRSISCMPTSDNGISRIEFNNRSGSCTGDVYNVINYLNEAAIKIRYDLKKDWDYHNPVNKYLLQIINLK